MLYGTSSGSTDEFFTRLEQFKAPETTVRQAIGYLNDIERGNETDHDYPDFQTIESYMDRYESGQFGWYRLAWDRVAPSFGNVMKTYTLHPSSWECRPPRVVSIKEALLLMGFGRSFSFPPGMGVALRYQMVADSVSPVFA